MTWPHVPFLSSPLAALFLLTLLQPCWFFPVCGACQACSCFQTFALTLTSICRVFYRCPRGSSLLLSSLLSCYLPLKAIPSQLPIWRCIPTFPITCLLSAFLSRTCVPKGRRVFSVCSLYYIPNSSESTPSMLTAGWRRGFWGGEWSDVFYKDHLVVVWQVF